MPATSPQQEHVARMAQAYKHGHLALADIPAGARAAVQSMAKMTNKQLEDYKYMADHKPKKKSLL